MATRIPHIRADVWSGMWAPVQGNDASLVYHLVEDCHVARGLHNLSSVAVDHREYGAGNTACDATDVVGKVFPRSGRPPSSSGTDPGRCNVSLLLLTFRRQGWNSSIRRIHDQRRLLDGLLARSPQCPGGPVPTR